MGSVLGTTASDPIAEALGTGFQRFASPCGVFGLAKEQGKRLDVLAVLAERPGTGQFRGFVEQCKQEYSFVYFWEVLNPMLLRCLERYDFALVFELTPHGELNRAWKWEG